MKFLSNFTQFSLIMPISWLWNLPKRTIRGKLLLIFILVGTLLSVSFASVSYLGARDALLNEAFSSIDGLKESRSLQISNWISDLKRDVVVFAENSTVITSVRAFRNGLNSVDTRYGETHAQRLASIVPFYTGQPDLEDAEGLNLPYRSTHQRFHAFFKKTSEVYDYTDILIISPTGDVIYSVQKRSDFAINIFQEPYTQTNLSLAVQYLVETRTKETSIFVDFAFYPAYGTSPVSFVLTPVFDKSELLGIIAFELSVDQINTILNVRDGLGETGETYLVGQDGLFRTLSRFLDAPDLILNPSYRIETQAVLNGSDTQFLDNYQGNPVLSTWKPIPIEQQSDLYPDGLSWILVAERGVLEVAAPVDRLLALILIMVFTAIIFLFISSYFIADQISRPILSLKDAALQIAEGNFLQDINIKSNDEIGILAQAFEKMAKDIRILITDLQGAERLAKESSRLKSEFLSTMSHELRTPLNAITGFTSVLLAGWGVTLGEREKTMVERISENSTRLLALINDFLDLSRIEAGRMQLVPMPTLITEMVQGWQEQMSVLAQQKNLEFSVYMDPTLPETMIVDQEALSKVVINLLSNAFKFTETGSVALSVVSGMGQIYIHVKDTGIGIPLHAQEYIFDEFRQVDGSTTRKYGGTGLGLAIVRKVIALMGGKVVLESNVGEGSTFTLSLPVNLESIVPVGR